MSHATFTGRLGIGLLGSLVLLVGCATDRDDPTGRSRETDAAISATAYPGWEPTSLQKMRQELVGERQDVNDVLNTMFQLTNASAADLPATYETFSRQVAQVNTQVEAARRRATESRRLRHA